jgi:hypothetical protein
LTLIELMLAVLGCSLLLQVLLFSITTGLQAERNAELRGAAMRSAASEVARFRMTAFADLKAESKTWEVEMFERPFTIAKTIKPSSEFPETLWQIEVIVGWRSGGRTVTYRASTSRSRL